MAEFLQASKVVGIRCISHAASLHFFDFAISLSGLIAFFDISLDPVVLPVDRIEQNNRHMMHFPFSYRLVFLHLAISKLVSFWQASS